MLSCNEEGMCARVGDFVFWQILSSIPLYVWFLESFDIYIYIYIYIYYIYILYIYIYIYIYINEDIIYKIEIF